MSEVSLNSNDQLLNRQVMEIQKPDSMLQLEPEPEHDSENNVDEEDHRDGDASKGASEDEDVRQAKRKLNFVQALFNRNQERPLPLDSLKGHVEVEVRKFLPSFRMRSLPPKAVTIRHIVMVKRSRLRASIVE
ncbi:unnamed protein product [Orchesella dallaii]|uniref:Uncharacterized protein n=1 Tax=Orchesella dallaii TaxID=48710 RepID=A0ABP1QJG9_9HEXA